MKYVKIDNFNCNNCGNKEYDVIMDNDNTIALIICSECGSVYESEYEVIEE